MITTAVYSESSKVRSYLQTFFIKSPISKIICCSGFHQIFFDHVILNTTQLAVIDITGMNLSAPSFINRIFSHNPELDIIIIHFGSIEPYVRSAVSDIGVCRIVNCSSSFNDISAISSTIASHFAVSVYALSLREQQVLKMISEGMTTLEIAEKLGISSTTVTVYRKKIAKKIGSNRIAVQTRIALNLSLTSL
ncbi:MAG: response regulator transcription factor [Bacteroidetes bacterium]|nr:response regulator transcription factor [Bacteroidota bacterium]